YRSDVPFTATLDGGAGGNKYVVISVSPVISIPDRPEDLPGIGSVSRKSTRPVLPLVTVPHDDDLLDARQNCLPYKRHHHLRTHLRVQNSVRFQRARVNPTRCLAANGTMPLADPFPHPP